MNKDERAIRDLVSSWHTANAAGDLPLILNLMAEEVVFLIPGQPPMRGRDAFAKALQEVLNRFRIDSSSEIQEIEIAGDLAYLWGHLTVEMIPLQEGSPMRRAGYQLTILRKQEDGAWVVTRDANMLTAE